MEPLRPFEEYMYLDDRKTYPMACFIRLRFSGRLDDAVAQTAFDRATAGHPLLRSVVVEKGKEKYYWTKTNIKPRFKTFETADADWLPHAPRIVLSEEPGIGLYFIVRNLGDVTETDLLFQIHHTTCDGIGLLHLINDFLCLYGIEAGIAEPSILPSTPDPSTLSGRGKHSGAASFLGSLFWTVPSWIRGIGAVVRSYIVTPTSLVPMRLDLFHQTLPKTFPAIITRAFNSDETKKLLSAAKRQGVSLNDLLIRDGLLAVGNFRDIFFPAHADRHLRFSIPVNLRNGVSAPEHVANNVGMVFLDRNAHEDDAPEQLLNGVHREMKSNKYYDIGATFVSTLRLCKLIPGLLPTAIHRKRRVWATCVFSNLGKIFTCGPFVQADGRTILGSSILRQVDVVPPIRAWTAAAIGVATYAGALSISVHYDTQYLSREQGEELANMLREQFGKSMNY